MPTTSQDPERLSADQRRRAVALVVTLTANTRLVPQRYERYLLDCFEQGEMTLGEVSALLDASVYQLVYHSHATRRPTEVDLQGLLAWSRHYNAEHGITGLLLYSDGRYVQLLEGPEAAVSDLYAHIQRDARHDQVVMVSAGPGPRRFAEWDMDFGLVAPAELDETLHALGTPALDSRPVLEDPRLRALLEAFT